MVVGTIDREGRPHLVTMAYGLIGGMVVFTSFARSQKVVNLRRDPRMTCLIEDVGTRHEEIRGMQIIGTGHVSENAERTLDVLRAVKRQSTIGSRLPPGAEADSVNDLAIAAKRVSVTVAPIRIISWDHTRLLREGRSTYKF